MKTNPSSSILFAGFVIGLLILSVVSIEAGFQVSDARGRQRLVIAIVVVLIGLLGAGSTIFGLLVRSTARNQILQNRFPEATIVTIRKTRDLATQILIVNGRTPESGVPEETLGYYSSLVMDVSGAAIWTGGPRRLTNTWTVPVDRIRDVHTLSSADGLLLCLDVQKGSLPVTLRVSLVRLGRLRVFPMKEAEVEVVAKDVRSKLGL